MTHMKGMLLAESFSII